jgi:hypothetical protein
MQITMKLLFALMPLAMVSAQTDTPTNDPFYSVPANIASYTAGTVILNRVRPVNTTIDSPRLQAAYQIFYRTNVTGDVADGTVATVFVPTNPKTPAKIFSYQAAEDATNLDCATSYALVDGSSSKNTAIQKLSQQVISNALSKGYYVVASDAEGSKSAWLAGVTEGRACLDAIRATIKQWKLPTNTSVALFGYSGGAHTTVWASSLAASYAPKLNIVGASYGGTPVDLRAAIQYLNGGFYSLLSLAGLFGLANAYPTLNDYFVSVFNGNGRSDDAHFNTPGYCTSDKLATGIYINYLKFDFTEDILAPGTVASEIIDDESLLSTSSTLAIPVPKFPRYQYHSRKDDVVPFAPAQQYVDEQCKRGANLAFKAYASGNHVDTGFNTTEALMFTTAALEGKLTKIVCGQSYY